MIYVLSQSALLPPDFSLPRLTLAHILPDRLPQSQTEWAQLLESQQKYHDSELQKWREIIESSVMLLDQVRPHGRVALGLEGHCVSQPPARSPSQFCWVVCQVRHLHYCLP